MKRLPGNGCLLSCTAYVCHIVYIVSFQLCSTVARLLCRSLLSGSSPPLLLLLFLPLHIFIYFTSPFSCLLYPSLPSTTSTHHFSTFPDSAASSLACWLCRHCSPLFFWGGGCSEKVWRKKKIVVYKTGRRCSRHSTVFTQSRIGLQTQTRSI